MLFCKILPGGFFIKIFIYVDHKLFFGNSEIILTEFKEKISKRLRSSSLVFISQNSSGCRIQYDLGPSKILQVNHKQIYGESWT
jgi:hypothetical protein